jgi:hypothetical protein
VKTTGIPAEFGERSEGFQQDDALRAKVQTRSASAMNWVALRMLTGDRAKYLALVFAISISSFLITQQASIFAGLMNRTRSQILDVTDADTWVMDPATHGAYPPLSRADFSCMTAPLVRTNASLDPSDKTVMTMVLPHIMYYSRNLTNADAGGVSPPRFSPYPFVFEPDQLGYIIQRLSDTEADKIVASEADLLKDLSSYLCLKAGGPDRPASQPSR